jgi:hypothetical protein
VKVPELGIFERRTVMKLMEHCFDICLPGLLVDFIIKSTAISKLMTLFMDAGIDY